MCYTTEEQKAAGKRADRAFRGHRRDADTMNSIMGSTRKLTHEAVRIPHLWIPSANPWAPPTFHVPKNIKQILTDLIGEINNNTIIV